MQKYPSCRYHSELGTTLVHDEEEDRVLTPPSDGWSDTPVTSVAVAEPAPAEPEPVKVEVEAETKTAEASAETEPETASLDFQGEFGDGDD